MYLNFINYFRAVAIFLIVSSHCYALSDYNYSSIPGAIISNLSVGGTSFFVFISGFLFHYIFYKNFDYQKFMMKKVKFVLTPYLVMSFLPVVFYVFVDDHIWEYFLPNGDGIFDRYFIPFLKYYATGFRIVAYWYIPFAMIIFAISPLFLYFIQFRVSYQILIISVSLLISTLIHRPVYDSGYAVFQSVIYFLPVYLIGMLSSQQSDFIQSNFKKKELLLFALGVLLAAIPLYFGQEGLLRKPAFDFRGFDLMILQKIVFCIFFMVWLSRFEYHKSKLINLLAENSFGIFFIHPLLLIVLSKIKNMLNFTFPSNHYLIYLSVSLIIFSLSLALTLLVKRLFPAQSRFIIGS